MSPWRFHFGFVPLTSVARGLVQASPPVKLSTVERLGLWREQPIPELLLENFNRLLPGPQLLSETQVRWTGGRDTCIDLFTDRRRMRDLRVRVDLRESHLNFIADVAMVANQLGWLGISADGRIFRPSVRMFISEIHQSPAMRWVRGSMESLLARAGANPTLPNGLSIQ